MMHIDDMQKRTSVLLDIDDDNYETPEALKLIRAAMLDPTWDPHDPKNHGVKPSEAIEIILSSKFSTSSTIELINRIWGE